MMQGTEPFSHCPVLLDEAVRALALKSGDTVVDCTVGGGGHAQRILEETAPDGRFVGIDRDEDSLNAARKRLQKFDGRVSLARGNYSDLDSILSREKIDSVDGVLMDLGVSSFQFDTARRGFSFQHDGPLDMRMDASQPLTAEAVVNTWTLDDLTRMLRQYGEVTNARSVAKTIVRERARAPIRSTNALAEVVAMSPGNRHRKIHPATQVFQALRIAVNDELGSLREALPKAVRWLKLKGRICVISFHSLEDRIVKQFFVGLARTCVCPPRQPVCRCSGKAVLKLVVRKPVRPDEAELAANPRSRSAKMRIAEKINEADKEQA